MNSIVTENYKKEVLQCRSCNKQFHQSEVRREHVGQRGLSRKCPFCGSSTYGLVNYPIDEERLIYKDSRFFGVSNQRKKYIEKYRDFKEEIDELYI